MTLLTKAAELAEMIASTEEVDFFKRAEAHINENQKIREMIASIKELAKTGCKLPTLRKRESIQSSAGQN